MDKDYKHDAILVKDDAFIYGIKNNYYPKLKDNLDNNSEFAILGIKEARKTIRNAKEGDLFYYNPFNETYIKISDDIEMEFLKSKLLAYQSVFGFMGASKVYTKLENIRKKETNSELNSNATINKGKVNVGADVKLTSEYEETLRETLETSRTFSKKLNKSYHEIESYINEKAYKNDNIVQMLLKDYKDHDNLDGQTFNHTATLSTEINNRIDLTANVAIGVGDLIGINSNNSYKKLSKESKVVTVKIIVEF